MSQGYAAAFSISTPLWSSSFCSCWIFPEVLRGLFILWQYLGNRIAPYLGRDTSMCCWDAHCLSPSFSLFHLSLPPWIPLFLSQSPSPSPYSSFFLRIFLCPLFKSPFDNLKKKIVSTSIFFVIHPSIFITFSSVVMTTFYLISFTHFVHDRRVNAFPL